MHQHDPCRVAPTWLNDGHTQVVDEVLGLLKTGKEAEVFIVERRTLDNRQHALLAHKRYRPTKIGHKGEIEELGFTRARTFTNDVVYHEGRRFRRSREQRAVERMTDYGKRVLAERWPGQELDVLTRAHEAGVTVPYPVAFTGDGMLMQLIGDAAGAAPRLVNARLTADELLRAYDQLVHEMELLTRAGLVHADLSPFNILWWQERLWLIDFPQAVDLVNNPHGFDLLHHDVTTMCTWFARHGVDTEGEAVFAALLAEAW
ncbi:MAG: RIO1 family regulatory kinase/ATPase domain-containing protein [Microthrixaceae bacterium]